MSVTSGDDGFLTLAVMGDDGGWRAAVGGKRTVSLLRGATGGGWPSDEEAPVLLRGFVPTGGGRGRPFDGPRLPLVMESVSKSNCRSCSSRRSNAVSSETSIAAGGGSGALRSSSIRCSKAHWAFARSLRRCARSCSRRVTSLSRRETLPRSSLTLIDWNIGLGGLAPAVSLPVPNSVRALILSLIARYQRCTRRTNLTSRSVRNASSRIFASVFINTLDLPIRHEF